MKQTAFLLFACFLGMIGQTAFSTPRAWDGSNDCTESGNECPGNAECVDGRCVSSYGADVSSSGCFCCACEACVCERLPKCCSQDGYWDEDCITLCGGECGGYALDPDDVDCDGKACGWDGCFGSCGTCGPGLKCVDGACEPCVPECEGKECGPDGCGGICGWCIEWEGELCLNLLAPSFPYPFCFQPESITVPETGCCVSDTAVLHSYGETTCAEGYICRWDQAEYGYEDEPWVYDCFWDYSSWCPDDYDVADCENPDTWDDRCCNGAPESDYPRTCDFTPHHNCPDVIECGADGVGGSCGTCSDGEKCVVNNCLGCIHDCAGRSCGSDGCGGSCGTCEAGYVCIAGGCVLETGCGMVGDKGCCIGDWLVECINGKLWESECNPFKGSYLEEAGARCIWKPGATPSNYVGSEWTIGIHDLTEARYECGQVDESIPYLVEEDPTAEYPRECDFTPCTRDCTGKSCGDDGCGGTCGGCGDHRDCVDHQCVDRIPEPTPDVVEPVDALDADEPDIAEPSDAYDTDGTDSGDVPATDTIRDDMTPDLAGDTGNDLASDTHTDTTPPPDNVTESEPSPGCGCSGSTAPAWPGSGVLFVLLLCLCTVMRARTQKR